MTKANRTRQFIIDKTAPLFNKKGYAGTSLVDLTDATGLSKGALYGNFSNKEEIALAVFQYSMEKIRDTARLKLDQEEQYKRKLIRLLDFYGQYVFSSPIPGGCPLMNNAVEADDETSFIKNTVALEMKKTVDFMASLLDAGKRNGEFKRDTKSLSVAYTFFCAIEGAIVISRVSSSDAAMKAVLRHCKDILEQISL